MSLCLHPPSRRCLHLFLICRFSPRRGWFVHIYQPEMKSALGGSRLTFTFVRGAAMSQLCVASSCMTLIIANRLHLPREALCRHVSTCHAFPSPPAA